jgi:hypothetical protein
MLVKSIAVRVLTGPFSEVLREEAHLLEEQLRPEGPY